MAYEASKFDPANAVFVVYDKASTVVQERYGKGSFAQKRANALRKAKALNEKAWLKAKVELERYPGSSAQNALALAAEGRYAVAERMEFENEVVYWRQVSSLMNGAKVWERSDLPYYLSVSSNSYWEN